MTRNEARALWNEVGLNYDVLTPENLDTLRSLVEGELRAGDYFRGTLRCAREFTTGTNAFGCFYADLKCEADYFESRQAITFEADGFVGFAGWADDHNVQPFLSGFSRWVEELSIPQSS